MFLNCSYCWWIRAREEKYSKGLERGADPCTVILVEILSYRIVVRMCDARDGQGSYRQKYINESLQIEECQIKGINFAAAYNKMINTKAAVGNASGRGQDDFIVGDQGMSLRSMFMLLFERSS